MVLFTFSANIKKKVIVYCIHFALRTVPFRCILIYILFKQELIFSCKIANVFFRLVQFLENEIKHSFHLTKRNKRFFFQHFIEIVKLASSIFHATKFKFVLNIFKLRIACYQLVIFILTRSSRIIEIYHFRTSTIRKITLAKDFFLFFSFFFGQFKFIQFSPSLVRRQVIVLMHYSVTL